MNNVIKRLVCRGEYNKALKIINVFVEDIVTEPLCTSASLGSKSLDQLCQYIGRENLRSVSSNVIIEKRTDSYNHCIIYIVTKFQKTGGHSRVIEDFIRADTQSQHIILSTELDGKSDVDYLMNGVAKQANVIFEKAPRKNFYKKLCWLQRRLLEIQPDKLFLFNHHQDSVAVAAIQPEMNIDSWFYHHGDHHLCLGVFLPFFKHIDPNPLGYLNCRKRLGINNLYIPLAVADKCCRSSKYEFMNEGTLTTCTAAGSNKIEKPYFISYSEVIPKLLYATGGKHIHIGKLNTRTITKIKKSMRAKEICDDKFMYIPWVPSVWNALKEHDIDLYLSSFPVGGALTTIEAMGAGVPVLMHKHISSRFLSCIDLAYEEALSWRHVPELIKICTEMTPDFLRRQSLAARKQYEKYHSYKIFENAVKSQGIAAPELKSKKFEIEFDEVACMTEHHISLSHLVYRFLYRLGKRLRAHLSF